MKRKLLTFAVIGSILFTVGYYSSNKVDAKKADETKPTASEVDSKVENTSTSAENIDGSYKFTDTKSNDSYEVKVEKLANGDISTYYTVGSPVAEEEEEAGHDHSHDQVIETGEYASGILSKVSESKWKGTIANLVSNKEWDVEATLSGNTLNYNFLGSREFTLSSESKEITNENPNEKLSLVLTK